MNNIFVKLFDLISRTRAYILIPSPRLEMPKKNLRVIVENCGWTPPDDWEPAKGELIGFIYGIPLYCNPDVEELEMIGASEEAKP